MTLEQPRLGFFGPILHKGMSLWLKKNKIDALIIGAGHNGLVCAHYLARAGLKVAIYERRNIVGDAAVTEEFHSGFRNSVASYTVSLLNPQVIKKWN